MEADEADGPESPPPSEERELVATSVLAPGLHLVATPIGHLQDITLRALETLRGADLIACEDTRHSGRLLGRYQIHKPLVSLNEHNEARRIPEIIERIQCGAVVALISDAGMPTVSDPGQRLVAAIVAAGLPVQVMPGPSAVLTALAASGLPTMPFYFGGFLPHKKGQRAKELAAARLRDCTSVYFESPYRLVDTLDIICQEAPEHRHVVARELTKHFEEFRRGSARSLLEHFKLKTVKGEICLLVAPHELPKWITW
jgi:16S rRNA (cytidine1402-2'-O)-methyltransferase